MHWRAWMFVVMATGWGVGCSLLYSADPLTSGRSNAEGGADAVADAAEAGDASAPCDPSFLFCDGFEDTLDAWAPVTLNGGTATIDSTMAHRGRSSLHARLPADTVDIRAGLSPSSPPPSWGRPTYYRFFLYLNVAHTSYLAVLLLAEPAPSPSELILSADYGPYLTLDTQSTPDGGHSGALSTFSLHQWTCVELEVDGANATVWMNGDRQAIVSFAQPTENLKMDLGLRANGGPSDPAYDAWFDDVAVANTRIGCDR
jgi:hypothetical protein